MLVIKQTWTIDRATAASSGGQTAIELNDNVTDAVMYIDHSTLTTTNSFSFQSAQQSSGPWTIEGSTVTGAAGTASTNFALRVTGPVGPWVRPYLHTASSGGYDFLLIGVA